MKSQPKWKLFEKDIHAIHSMFKVDGSTIRYDDRILGVDSKVQRQIDVSIRTQIETYSILIAIECKNKKRPIDVPEVGEFSTLAKDVRANKGVIISTSGFTSGAITWGTTHGLDLLTFRKGEGVLHGFRTIPFLCIQNTAPWSAEVKLLSHLELGVDFVPSHYIEIFSELGESKGTLASFVAMSGREGKIPTEPGEVLLTSSRDLFIRINGTLVRADVRAHVWVERRFFFHLSPVEEVVISDASTGSSVRRFLRSALVYLQPWDDQGKASGWREISSTEELSITPVYTIVSNPSWL